MKAHSQQKKTLRLAAAGGLLAALALVSCGEKPRTSKKERQVTSVATETGELPAAGRANRLLTEQSAFLRRHANDPVEWYPWGKEAFAKAKSENKPLLVSIGYASCPWSQKMHTESFLDPMIARFMNRHFICVLVDREERPDVNTTFLHYAFTKKRISGWPLHIWLTPDGLPIYEGVYFAKENQGQIASWSLTLEHVANQWESGPEYFAGTAKLAAEGYLADFRRRWLGPPPEGNTEIKEVKDFLAMTPEAQISMVLGLNDDNLQRAFLDLPATKVDEIWSKFSPEKATGIIERLRPVAAVVTASKVQGPVREQLLHRFIQESRNQYFEKMRSTYDPSYGGFGPPPRFAPHQALDFLVRYAQRERGHTFHRDREAVEMFSLTIDKILAGGMRDQLGDGFHRYSTDVYWAVPQFEKMLYDQGYMAMALLMAGQMLEKKEYLDAAAGALNYASRELSHPAGGFYCAEGSSSKGKDGKMSEGAYYVWDKSEIESVTGPNAPLVEAVYGIESGGNLPMDSVMRGRVGATNILMVRKPVEEAAKVLNMDPATARTRLEEARARMLAVRAARPRPTLEDKILTSWSGVAISGFAKAGFVLEDAALLSRGEKAANFILEKLVTKEGGLLHAYLDGPSPLPAYSEDYSTFVAALLDLYEATGNANWLSKALQLQARQITDLWDKEDGGFFDGPDSELLFHRMKSMDEASEMAAGSTSLLNLVQIHNMLNMADYRDKARRIVERYGPHAATMPGAFTRFLRAAEYLLDPPPQFVLTGAPDDPLRKELLKALRACCRPGSPLLYMDGGDSQKLLLEKVPDLAPLSAAPGKAAVHICRGFKAEKSFTTAVELSAYIKAQFTMTAK